MRTLLISLIVALTAVTAFGQSNKPEMLTLEGQFVCSQCWSEADRKTTPYGTAADMVCAEECAGRDVPPAIAVKRGDDYELVLVEAGKLKKSSTKWLEFIGKHVRVSGRAHTVNNQRALLLDELTVTGDSQAVVQSNAIGSEAELVLKDLFGVNQKLSSYRGRLVVLNFWATWCLPCRKEMPDLAAIQNDYAALGVQVVGAAANNIDDRQGVLNFIKQYRINFPVWLGATTDDMKAFGLGPALPGTAIIGRDGKIVWASSAVVSRAELRRELDKLFASDARSANLKAPARHEETGSSLVPS